MLAEEGEMRLAPFARRLLGDGEAAFPGPVGELSLVDLGGSQSGFGGVGGQSLDGIPRRLLLFRDKGELGGRLQPLLVCRLD